MSIELTTKVWFKEQRSASSKFETLLNLVDSHRGDQVWKRLSVRAADFRTVLAETNEVQTVPEVLDFVAEHSGQPLYLAVNTAIRCWRFRGTETSFGHIPLTVISWDQEFTDRMGGDRRLEGDAKVLVDSAGPYTALVGPNVPDAVKQVVNPKVEENLERVQQMLFSISTANEVASLKSFSANCLSYPMNANLIYYEDAQSILDDLQLIRDAWHVGFDAYQTPRLRSTPTDSFVLHPYRDQAMQQELHRRLDESIMNVDLVNLETLRQIDWRRYDNLEGESGRVVLTYPRWMNGFVSQLYLDVLGLVDR